jgi:two-component system chemotaxis sensor kinase CheA
MDEMQEILEDFLIEAFEMNEQLDQDLVELESNPEDLDLLNRIFRVAHTIKGSGSFLNFDVLTHLTHHMEDILNKARHGELKITPDVMDVVLESIDAMKGLLNHIRDSGSDTDHGLDVEGIVAKLDAISKGGDIPETSEAPAPKKQETKAKAKVEAEEVVEEPTKFSEDELEADYSDLSDDELENEIERLLKIRQEEDKARRKAKKEQGDDEDEVVEAPKAVAAKPAPAKQEAKPVAPAPKPKQAPVQEKESKKISTSSRERE